MIGAAQHVRGAGAHVLGQHRPGGRQQGVGRVIGHQAKPLRVGLPGDGQVLLPFACSSAEQCEGHRQRKGLHRRHRGGRLCQSRMCGRRAQLEPPHHRQMARRRPRCVLGRCHVQHHQLQGQRTRTVVKFHAGLHLAADAVGVGAQFGHRQGAVAVVVHALQGRHRHRQHQEGGVADDVERTLLRRHQMGLGGHGGQKRAAQCQSGQRGTAPALRGRAHNWPFTQRCRWGKVSVA